MPNRVIREDILTSEKVASLSWVEEVFYRRLMSIVDDYGRCEASIAVLRARLYPLQVDRVCPADIEKWILATVEAGLCKLYSVENKKYLQVENFGQQARTKSRIPAPECGQMISTLEQLKTIDSKCYQMISNENAKKASLSPLPLFPQSPISPESPNPEKNTPIPRKVFKKPSPEEVAAYAASRGVQGFDGENFCDHYEQKGWVVGKTPMKNWQAAVRLWIRTDSKNENKFKKSGFDPNDPSTWKGN